MAPTKAPSKAAPLPPAPKPNTTTTSSSSRKAGAVYLPRQATKAANAENSSGAASNWSPLSDGILPISSGPFTIPGGLKSDEEVVKNVDKYIDNVLYGKGKSRLPVFEELCREKKG
ncbi:hypothetical protein BUALT_Bualt11G0009000 [Buddleja alternifolia]|uniref:Uncharacterized protein n=1 Tax=Buddleja alternifolia TaxID=168488 RepID=A0AAV6WZM9_9LAMI|nr:hypothetical protein BUALT_Bualt11G0009000 [Buddleja alternifolia]